MEHTDSVNVSDPSNLDTLEIFKLWMPQAMDVLMPYTPFGREKEIDIARARVMSSR